jgi:hypothetical protein
MANNNLDIHIDSIMYKRIEQQDKEIETLKAENEENNKRWCNELDLQIKYLEIEKNKNTKLKEQLKEVKDNIERMFLELGSKWHDNEITIKNPTLFLSSWKRELTK